MMIFAVAPVPVLCAESKLAISPAAILNLLKHLAKFLIGKL